MAVKVGIPSEFRCGSTRYSDTQLSSRQMAKGNSTTTMTDDDSDSNSGADPDNISTQARMQMSTTLLAENQIQKFKWHTQTI